jgi:hypothetical protein
MTTDVIGVATYRIGSDGTLDGVWTVPEYAGRLGRELVTGGTPGQLAGTHRVEIYDPDGQLVFHGTLEIVPEGQAWRFLYTGTGVTGEPERYEGLALQQGEHLALSYWGVN